MPTLTVGAIAFDPSDPRKVYCGTGEGNSYWWLGVGIGRSNDGGSTWELLQTKDFGDFEGAGFYRLVVDPTNGLNLWAATTRGLYASGSSGSTWAPRRYGTTWDFSSHVDGAGGVEMFAACGDGLQVSTDGGEDWFPVDLPGNPQNIVRMSVAHAPSDPGVVYVFAAADPSIPDPRYPAPAVMPTPYLWQRSVAGGAFFSIALPDRLITDQADYDWCLAVAPDNANQIYIGAVDLYRGDIAGPAGPWTNISTGNIHSDQHAICFHPTDSSIVYAGNDGGLFRSRDRGAHWESLNDGLAITEIEYLSQDNASPRWLLAGTQDNGTIRYTGSAQWEHVADGDGGYCGVDQQNANRVFHTFTNMGIERSARKGDIDSFVWIGPDVDAIYQGYRSAFYAPIAVNASTVVQVGQSAFVSRDSGASWIEVALPADLTGSALCVPTPDAVYVGTENGRMFRIGWNGDSWSSAIELASPRFAYVSDLLVDGGNLKRIWMTCSAQDGGHVFRSDDAGVTWQDLSASLPSVPVNAIEVDGSNAGRIWLATDWGVYQSLNDGKLWTPFGTGLPNALVEDLQLHPQARVLRAGTRSRGVWEIAVGA